MKKLVVLSVIISATTVGFAQTQPIDSNLRKELLVGQMAIEASSAILQLIEDYTQENKNAKTLKGYRVQIFNGSKYEAQKLRIAFLKAFPDVEVVMIYQTPEYKIQAGNFRTRLEAERLLDEIRATFKGVFVVKTIIDFPKLKAEK